jgi:hypothetical protein
MAENQPAAAAQPAEAAAYAEVVRRLKMHNITSALACGRETEAARAVRQRAAARLAPPAPTTVAPRAAARRGVRSSPCAGGLRQDRSTWNPWSNWNP